MCWITDRGGNRRLLRAARTGSRWGTRALFAGPRTKTVLRVTTEAETPCAFPLQGVKHVARLRATAKMGVYLSGLAW